MILPGKLPAALLLMAVAAVTLLSIPVSEDSDAVAGEFTVDDLVYRCRDSSVWVDVVSYRGISVEITVPESVTDTDGVVHKVYGIGIGAFSDNADIVSVTLPEGLGEIGSDAFKGCSSLENVVLPTSLEYLNESSFEDDVSLVSVNIPGNVKTVSRWAFSGCTSLESVTVMGGVQTIGAGCFRGCTALSVMSLPSTTRTLGSGVFEGCTSLESIGLGNGLTAIPNECFKGCTSLTSIVLPRNVSQVGEHAFLDCSSLARVDIVNGNISPASIAEHSFYLRSEGTGTCSVNCSSDTYPGDDMENVRGFDPYTRVVSDGVFNLDLVNYFGEDPIHYELKAGAPIPPITPSRDGFKFDGWDAEIPVKMPATDLVFTAHWLSNRFNVTFNPNGGLGSSVTKVHDNDTLENDSFLIAGRMESETGFFAYWSVNPNSHYFDPATDYKTDVDDPDYRRYNEVLNADKTFYAIWVPAVYYVQFDPNGGEGVMEGQALREDTPTPLRSNIFIREGYIFQHWTDNLAGGNTYPDGGEISNFRGTLHAIWAPVTYRVVFEANGGTEGSVGDITLTYDQPYTMPVSVYGRLGYTQVSWNTHPGDTSNRYDPGRTYSDNLSSTQGATVHLYAVWHAHAYVLNFHGNADTAEGEMASKRVSYGISVNISRCAFTNKFHEFAGWALAPKGDVVFHDGDSIANLSPEENANINLYATWEVGSYRIVYDPGNGDGHMDFPLVRNFTEYVIEDCAYVCEGYHFKEWRILYSDGSYQSYHPGDVVTNLSDGRDHIVLNAVWEKDDTGMPAWVLYSGVSAAILVAILGLAFISRRRV